MRGSGTRDRSRTGFPFDRDHLSEQFPDAGTACQAMEVLRMRHLFMFIMAVAGCCLLSSCSKSPYELGYVHGTATCNGKPMTSGVVIFAPIPKDAGNPSELVGKPAHGKFTSEGKFVLSTYGDEDGAVAGRHTAQVTHPGHDDDDDDEGEAAPGPPCGGTVFEPGTKEPRIFEIVAGETHEFSLEFTNSRVTAGPWAAP